MSAFPKWQPAEDALLRKHFPDFNALAVELPHRTHDALNRRASKLGIRAKHYSWTGARNKKIREAFAAGKSVSEITSLLPGATRRKVQDQIWRLKLTPRVPTKRTFHHPVIPQIRDRAAQGGIALRALARQIDTHNGFARSDDQTSLISILRAVEYFGGEIDIAWDED